MSRNGRARLYRIEINVLQYPLPTAARCYKLGQAVRRAIESFPQDLKVAVVGTGGLSHQIHGERTGFNNPEWDDEFLRRMVDDPLSLTRMRHADFVRLGGAESVEVIMWAGRCAARSMTRSNVFIKTFIWPPPPRWPWQSMKG